jgi:hypothetical protein
MRRLISDKNINPTPNNNVGAPPPLLFVIALRGADEFAVELLVTAELALLDCADEDDAPTGSSALSAISTINKFGAAKVNPLRGL